jgi:hypothetical protein
MVSNSYRKVSTVSAKGEELHLSKTNHQYGSTVSEGTSQDSVNVNSLAPSFALLMVYISVLIGDMARGVLFPTV